MITILLGKRMSKDINVTKEITERFKELKEANPYWSSWTCFSVSIKHRKLTKSELHKLFYKLVNKSDYFEEDEKKILEYLDSKIK